MVTSIEMEEERSRLGRGLIWPWRWRSPDIEEEGGDGGLPNESKEGEGLDLTREVEEGGRWLCL